MKKVLALTRFLLLVWCFSSCGMHNHGTVRPINLQQLNSNGLIHQPLVVTKHDTIKIKPSKMTPEELQKYLNPLYKANYDQFFKPEFDQMLSDNRRLAKAANMNAQALDKILGIYFRQRSKFDSLKMHDNSLLAAKNRETNEKEGYQKQLLKMETAHTAEVEKQIGIGERTNNIIFIFMGVVAAALLSLYIFIGWLAGKVKRQNTELHDLQLEIAQKFPSKVT